MSDLLNHIPPEVVTEYDRLREDCGIVDLAEISLLTLSGDDRKGWLQGQATNNLRSMDQGASCSFCLCEPTGQILSMCDLWSVDGKFLISLPAVTMDSFLARVEQMVVLEDVVAEDVTSNFRLVSIQGPRATAALSQMVALPSLDGGSSTLEGVDIYTLRSNRTGMGGWDVWVPADAEGPIEALTSGFATVGAEAYDIARIEAGSPRYGQDLNRKTLPAELGSQFESRYVSYNKGCYTGQEVLMRMHSRGHANRTWVGLLSEHAFDAGALVSHANRPEAGVVTSAAFSPDFGYIGAAMLRSEVAQASETVTIGGSVSAEVRLMPILRMG